MFFGTRVERGLRKRPSKVSRAANGSASYRATSRLEAAGSGQRGWLDVLLEEERRLIARGESSRDVPTLEDGELVRMERRLARNPSLWTSRVDVVRSYSRVNGALVPISLDSTAHLRLLRRSTLSMDEQD